MKKAAKISVDQFNKEVDKIKSMALDQIDEKIKELNKTKMYLENEFASDLDKIKGLFFEDRKINENSKKEIIENINQCFKDWGDPNFYYHSTLFLVLLNISYGLKDISTYENKDRNEIASGIMTAVQAAEEAGVSRPYITKQSYDILDTALKPEEKEGKLPIISLGPQHKILFRDDFEKWNKRRKVKGKMKGK